MIEKVTNSLLGKNEYTSNMESAARTSLVMDKIMGRDKPITHVVSASAFLYVNPE